MKAPQPASFSIYSCQWLTAFILTLSLTSSAYAQTYVNLNATGGNDGSTWLNAYNDLQVALTNASFGDEIWVAAGTYYPSTGTNRASTFTLPTGVRVYGGFIGTETMLSQQDWENNITILSGDLGVPNNNMDNAFHVVTATGTLASTIINGFTIRDGNADTGFGFDTFGGGLFLQDGNATISNCRFESNFATFIGGAIYISSGSPTIDNCSFINNNSPSGLGGAISNATGGGTINNCLFEGNTGSFGGAISNDDGPLNVSNSIFINNSATDGGGISNNDNSPTITNCLFLGNSATDDGGGAYNDDGTPTYENCVFSGNNAADVGGGFSSDVGNATFINVTFSNNNANDGGAIRNGTGVFNLRNAILWNNTATSGNPQILGSITANNSIVQGGYTCGGCTGIIDQDPQFVDADGTDNTFGTSDDDLQIQLGSPAIDMGNNGFSTTSIDLAGNPRIDGGTIDLGAYEYAPPSGSNLSIAAAVSSDYNGQDISCNGETDGEATVTISGGTSPYTISWNTSPPQTGLTATGLGAGTYTVTVTDNAGASRAATVTLTEPDPVLSFTTVTTAISCPGATNGALNVSASDGTPPYSFAWNTTPAQTTANATGLGAGSYSVVVTDANGCTASSSINLNDPPAITASASVTSDFNGEDVSCMGATDGEATATASGGAGTFFYSWNTTPAQTTPIATGLGAGSYTVTILDANLCSTTATVTLTEPTAVGVSTNATTDPTCATSTDGSIDVTASGGTSPYSFLWNTTPVQSSSTANNLGGGTYMVTATDANGCTANTSATLTAPTAVSASISGSTDPTCATANDGSASVSASGGTGPYMYSWHTTPSQNTPMATGLGQGSYTVTVTDDNGCSNTASVTLTAPANTLSATVAVSSNYNSFSVSCNGAMDGQATVTPTGGNGGYTYSWHTTPSQSSATATGLGAGTYDVTVSDGCAMVTESITLTEPTSISLTSTPTNPNCGLTDGSVTLTTSGGAPPYNFSWSNGATTEDLNNVGAGTYTLTVTDANSCTETISETLTEITGTISLSTVVTSFYNGFSVSCAGSTDGAASVTPSGGSGTYTYSWHTTPSQSSPTAVNLGPGIHYVTVSDGCTTALDSITLNEPSPLALSAIPTNPNCGNSDGEINMSIAGGVFPYTFAWSNGAITEDLLNLPAGTYTLNLTDNNGCTATFSETLTSSGNITVTTTVTDANCFGGMGSIEATATGGTSPYTYDWSDGSTGSTLNAVAGSYTVTVTDNNGCSSIANATINEPAEIMLNLDVTDILCAGGDGAIDLTITNGIAPFSFSWSNGATTEDLNGVGIPGGSYSVTVVDDSGCTATASATINEPTAITIDLSTTDASCGQEDGSIDATVSGGNGNYSYVWSNGAFSQNLTNLGAGTYSVTVTDGSGCNTMASATISSSGSINISHSVMDVSCHGDNNGFIASFVSGGTPPLSYSWNTGATSIDIFDLAPGNYTLSVVDGAGCTGSLTSTVNEPAPLTLATSSAYDETTNTGIAMVEPTGGTNPYTFVWSSIPVQTTRRATGLSAGEYSVVVTDANGCTETAVVSVEGGDPLACIDAHLAFTPNADGVNDFFEIPCLVSMKNTLEIYNRWGQRLFDQENYDNSWDGTIQGKTLPDGTYYYSIQMNEPNDKRLFKGTVTIIR